MALIRCPECAEDVSDRADACPHCGRQLGSHYRGRQTRALAGGIVAACLLGAFMLGTSVGSGFGESAPSTIVLDLESDGAVAAATAGPSVPLAPTEVTGALNITDARLGLDAFVDAAGMVRLKTLSSGTFRVTDDINAVVYAQPRTFRLRDLSFDTRWEIERPAGDAPAELRGHETIARDWDEAFIRACVPATEIDADGSDTPLRLTLFVEEQLVKTFTIRIEPGPPPTGSTCRANPGQDQQIPTQRDTRAT